MIHKTEYVEWKNHPVTQALFDVIHKDLAEYEEVVFTGDVSVHSNIALNIGIIRALSGVANFKPDFNDDGFMLDSNDKVIE